jgi:hypothetical protein
MPIFLIWLTYRVLTSLWATFLSGTRPLTNLEKTLPIWPPPANLGIWLERTWLLPWQRWDVDWYLKIVTAGYQNGDGTAQFHPLYPWLALPLVRLGLNPLFSLLLVSSLAGLIFMYVFEKLARMDLDRQTAFVAVLLLAAFPTGFILFAPYTESLFLLCAAACFYLMLHRKWILAGIMGGLAALARQQGIFLALPLAWEIWVSSGQNLKAAVKNWRGWAALAGPPAGLLLWLAYRAVYLSDFQLKPDLKSLVYAGIISSSAVKVVPVYQFVWPWQALWLALSHLKNPDVDILINLILGGIFVLLLLISWPRLSASYRIYSAAIALVSFSYYTGPVHPYMGLTRHLYLAFPIFIGLAPFLAVQKRWLIYIVGGTLGMLFLIAGYSFSGWVP